jgi:hypothetical protein
MTIQYSPAVNNARLDAIETAIGTAPLLRFYSGSQPASCATAASGTLLSSQALPSDWLAAASNPSKAKAGTWAGTFSTAGTAGYYRIYDSTGTTCHLQGSVTITGSGGDLQMDNPAGQVGQAWTVTSYQINTGNQ